MARMKKATQRMARQWDRLPAALVDHVAERWEVLLKDIPQTTHEPENDPALRWGQRDRIAALIPLLAVLHDSQVAKIVDAIEHAILDGTLSMYDHPSRHAGDMFKLTRLLGDEARARREEIRQLSS